MSSDNSEEVTKPTITETERYQKLTTIRKLILNITIVILWFVAAIFNILELRKGESFFGTPWTYLTVGITLLLVFVVLVPFRKHIKEEFQQVKQEKDEKTTK